MKKYISVCILLCLLFGLCSLTANAESTQAEKTFSNEELIIKINRPFQTKLWVTDDYLEIYSVGVNASTLINPNKEKAETLLEKNGYLEYRLSIHNNFSVSEAIEYLEGFDDIISAEPVYYDYPNANYNINKTLVSYDGKQEYFAYEVTLTLKDELDLSQFNTAGPFELYGVTITSVNKSESDTPFTYKVIIDTTLTVAEAIDIFSQNENVISASRRIYGRRFFLGDVDLNEKIDSMDYIILKRIYFGTYDSFEYNYSPLRWNQEARADINKNGEIDSMDYILLKRAYFGTYNIE